MKNIKNIQAKKSKSPFRQFWDAIIGPIAEQNHEHNEQLRAESSNQFPLTRINFILMAIAGAAIIIGFLLMLGPKTTAAGFEPDIFSTRRIVIGPAIAFLGFVFMGFGIIFRPKSK